MNDISTQLVGMLFGNESLMKKFNKDLYKDAFYEYYDKYRPLLNDINDAYNNAEDKQAFLDEIAQEFVDYAKSKEAMLTKKSDKEHFWVDHNSVLTVYTLPAMLEIRLDSCNMLVSSIVRFWNEAFTRYNISTGTFSEIDGGFKRKLCYITTAVCESLGKSDDCYELETLRSYRDEYLLSSEDGKVIVDQYYNVAPTIVNRINKSSDSTAIYNEIYNTYISPCISRIEAGDKEGCMQLYSDMVFSLSDKYMR